MKLEGKRGRPIGIAFAALVLAAAVAGAAAAAILTHSATKASRITVTEREFRLTLSRRTFKPGTVTFVVMNRGKLRHSLAIRGPGVSRRIRGTIAPGGETHACRAPVARDVHPLVSRARSRSDGHEDDDPIRRFDVLDRDDHHRDDHR